MKLGVSFVIPIYNEKRNIPLLYGHIVEVMKDVSRGYEIIFVNDGSTDGSDCVLDDIAQRDKRVKIVHFRRNLQKAAALSAGFSEAFGDLVFTLDGDLQDDPREIPRMIEKIEKGYDLVVGWKKHRKDPVTKLIASRFFNTLTRFVTGVRVHDSNCGYKVFKRDVLNDLKLYGELHRYIPSIIHMQGYRVSEIPVRHHQRRYGKSKYGWTRLYRGFFDLLTVKFLMRYGTRPMHFFGTIGFLFIAVGVVLGISLVIEWLGGALIGTRPLLILSILCVIIGVQLVSMGFIGEMVTHLKEGS